MMLLASRMFPVPSLIERRSRRAGRGAGKAMTEMMRKEMMRKTRVRRKLGVGNSILNALRS